MSDDGQRALATFRWDAWLGAARPLGDGWQPQAQHTENGAGPERLRAGQVGWPRLPATYPGRPEEVT